MSEEVNAGGESTTPEPAPATTTPAAKEPEPRKQTEGVIPLSMHEEKVGTLHKDLSKERAEIKRLREENETLAKENGTFKLNHKKSEAFDAAVAGLGEDFEIQPDKVPKVKEFLAELPDSETLADKVAGFLDLVKAPKAKQKFGSSFTGVPANQNQPVQFQPGQKLTPYEMGQLSESDHAAYIRSRQAR